MVFITTCHPLYSEQRATKLRGVTFLESALLVSAFKPGSLCVTGVTSDNGCLETFCSTTDLLFQVGGW